MKSFLLILALLSVQSVFAQEDASRFEEHKKEVLADMDTRIGMIQTEKSCIASATNRDGIKKCREAAKAEHDKFHASKKQENMQKIDDQIKKLEAKKQQMQQKK
jgi:hypothetical protein